MLKKSETKFKQRRVSFDQGNDEIPRTESVVGVTDIQRELEIWDDFLHPHSSEGEGEDSTKEESGEKDFVEQVSEFPGADEENALQWDDWDIEPTRSKDDLKENEVAVKYRSDQDIKAHATNDRKQSLQEISYIDQDSERTFGFKNKVLENEERRQSMTLRRTSGDFHTNAGAPPKVADEMVNKFKPRSLSLQVTDTDGNNTIETIEIGKTNEKRRKTMPPHTFTLRTERVIDAAVLSAVHEYQKYPEILKKEAQAKDDPPQNVSRVHSDPLTTAKEEREESQVQRRHTIGYHHSGTLHPRPSFHDDHISEESIEQDEVEEVTPEIPEVDDFLNASKFRSYSVPASSPTDTAGANKDKEQRRHTVARSFEIDETNAPVEPAVEEVVTEEVITEGIATEEVVTEEIATEDVITEEVVIMEAVSDVTEESIDGSNVGNSKTGRSYSLQLSSFAAANDERTKRRHTLAQTMRLPGSDQTPSDATEESSIEEVILESEEPAASEESVVQDTAKREKPYRSNSMQSPGTTESKSAAKTQRRHTHAHDQLISGAEELKEGAIDFKESSDDSANGGNEKEVVNSRKITQRSHSMQAPASRDEAKAEEKSRRRHTVSQGAVSAEKPLHLRKAPAITEASPDDSIIEEISDVRGDKPRAKSMVVARSQEADPLDKDNSKRRHTMSETKQRMSLQRTSTDNGTEPTIETSTDDLDGELVQPEVFPVETKSPDEDVVEDREMKDGRNIIEERNDATDEYADDEFYEGSGESSGDEAINEDIKIIVFDSRDASQLETTRPATREAGSRMERRYTVVPPTGSTDSSQSRSDETITTTSDERQLISSDEKPVSEEESSDKEKKKTRVAFSNDVSFEESSDFKENLRFGMVRNSDIRKIYDKEEIYYEDSGKNLLHSTPSNQFARQLINNAVEKGTVQYTAQTEALFEGNRKKRKIKFSENIVYSDNQQKAVDDEKPKDKQSTNGTTPIPIMKPSEEENIAKGSARRKDTGVNFTAHPPKVVQRKGTLEMMRKRPKYLKRKDTMELMEMKGKRKPKKKETEKIQEHGADNEAEEGVDEDVDEELGEEEEVEEECIEETITGNLETSHGKGMKLKKKGKKKKAHPSEQSTDDGEEPKEEKAPEPFSKINALLASLNKIGTMKLPEKVSEEIVQQHQKEELEMVPPDLEQPKDEDLIQPQSSPSEESQAKGELAKDDESGSRDSGKSEEKTSEEQEENSFEEEEVMSKSAKHLASETVLSALDEMGDEVETISDDHGDVDKANADKASLDKAKSEVKPSPQRMEPDAPTGKRRITLSEPSSLANVKAMYSISSFEKTAAEFLAESPNSLTSNVATIDSKTTRSFTTSSSGTLRPGSEDIAKKISLEEAQKKKLARRNTTIPTRQKRASTACPPGSDLPNRRHTTHSSPPTGRDSSRRFSQFENSRMYQRLQDRHRMQSIDKLTNFMGPISSDEDTQQKKSQDHRKPVKEHIEPSVVHTPEPPSIEDFVESQNKLEKERRTTFMVDMYQKPSSSSLSNLQFLAFRRLFTRLNKSATTGLTADDLYYAIQDLLPDVDISFEESRALLKEFDIKGTGEINFDEFLYAMTHPTNYLKLLTDDHKTHLKKEVKLWEKMTYKKICEDSVAPVKGTLKRGYSVVGGGIDKRKSLFFKMLKTAAVKYSIKEIPQYYETKIQKLNDHVVHHWSSGQRCAGLSAKHIKMRFDEIKKQLLRSARSNKDYSDSPYAIPLIWDFDQALEFEKKKEKERKIFIERARAAGFFRRASYKPRPKSVEPRKSKKIVVKEGKPRPTTAKPMTRNLKLVEGTGYKVVTKTHKKVKKMQENEVPRKAKRKEGQRPKLSEFLCTPKMVALPKFNYLKNYRTKVNYNELPEIRQRTARVLERYYNALRRIAATNARNFYDRLYVEQMPPRMRELFTHSYRAYTGKNQPFVVSPWIPFPEPASSIPYPPLGKSFKKQAWNLE